MVTGKSPYELDFKQRVELALRIATRFMVSLVDPSPLLLTSAVRHQQTPRAALVCVYRYANAHYVKRMIDSGAFSVVALWALDMPHPQLAQWTVGCGTGTRFELLNVLLASVETDTCYLVVADDDVLLHHGGTHTMLRACVAYGLDLAQPAHGALSRSSWPFNRFRAATLARQTTWVEQGPLLVVSPRANRFILPFPEELGMGWGIETRWSLASEGRFTLGVIDGVRVRHCGRIGKGYEPTMMFAQADRMLMEAGLNSTSDIQRVSKQWLASEEIRRLTKNWRAADNLRA